MEFERYTRPFRVKVCHPAHEDVFVQAFGSVDAKLQAADVWDVCFAEIMDKAVCYADVKDREAATWRE